MKKIVLFVLFIISCNSYAYNIIYTGDSIAAGNLLIGSYESAVMINNSFNSYRSENSISLTGALTGGSFLENSENIINLSVIASVAALKKYINIDIAYNLFSYNFYKNYLLFLGLSRRIGNSLGIGAVVKYGGESFTLTYDGETDPVLGSNNLSKNDYNFDLSVSYNYNNLVITGISFENILSYGEFTKEENIINDLAASVKINIMAKMFEFSIFNNNSMASEIDVYKNEMSVKTGISLGFYKYFSFKAGYISNEAITTGLGFNVLAGKLRFKLDYGLKYAYNISGLNNIVTLKINY